MNAENESNRATDEGEIEDHGPLTDIVLQIEIMGVLRGWWR